MSRYYNRDRYSRRYDEDEQSYDRDYERGRYGRESRYGRSDDEGYSQGRGSRRYGSESDYDRTGRGYNYGLDYDREFGTSGTPMRRGYDYGRGYDREYEDLAGDYGTTRSYGRGSSYGTSQRGMTGRSYGWEGSRSGYYDRDEDRDYGQAGEGYSERTSRGYGYGGRGRDTDYDRDRDTDYDRYREGRDDRSWWERTADEVRSWFGDEESERRRRMDEQHRGEHRGRGPRSYRRSDDRIREDINDRLTDHPYLDASDIDVVVSNGEVTLTGMVDNRNAKRMAEDIAEEVSGVSNVENRLRVRQSRWGATTGAQEVTTTTETTGTTRGTEAAATTTTTGSSGRRSS